MRKADYAALAAIIRTEIANARVEIDSLSQFSDDQAKDCARHESATAASIARQFAAQASVNRAEFLKACGIDP